MSKCFIQFIALMILTGTLHGVEVRKIVSADNKPMIQLENKYLKLDILPGNGGRIMSFYYKKTKTQMTDTSAGLLTENVWNVPSSRFFLNSKPYLTKADKQQGQVTVDMTGNSAGGGIDFLEVNKRVRMNDNSAAITVDYTFRNMPQAMASLNYGFWFHNVLGVKGGKAHYYYPSLRGIVDIKPKDQHHDRWLYRPSRGWCAVAVPNGTGIAAVMDYSGLKCFYSWFGKNTTLPTMEWRFEKINLKADGSFSTQVEYIPFNGLPRVSGAGHNIVGSLDIDYEESEPGDKLPIDIAVYSAVKQNVQMDLRYKLMPNGKWLTLAKQTLKFDKPASLQKLKLKFVPKKEGDYSFEAVLSSDNKELARLNAPAVCGNANGVYCITPLKESIKSQKRSYDFSKFSLKFKSPHIQWGQTILPRED